MKQKPANSTVNLTCGKQRHKTIVRVDDWEPRCQIRISLILILQQKLSFPIIASLTQKYDIVNQDREHNDRTKTFFQLHSI